MKVISLNCWGWERPFKRLSLRRLIYLHKLEFIFLQETMEREEVVIPSLKKFLMSWEFMGIDANG